MSQTSIDPQFDAYAAEYDAALEKGISVSGEDKHYFARGRLLHLSKVLRKLNFVAQSAMDFGCGTGSATPHLFATFPSVRKLIGTDVSERSLAIARRQHGSDAADFLLMHEYFPNAGLDLVFCNGVFHHIPVNQRTDCIRYIFDALRPGGMFALFENNPWNPGTRYVMSRIPFDESAITLSPPFARRLAREAGFQILRTDSLFYFPRALRILRPAETLLRKVPLGAQYLVLCQKHNMSV